ncbi:TPM domain-containing protein [Vagococcus xieshaowenii]|uniref:TPM domain-containing protein n=1 Tax=Vagococcus xieshaowenii TaxID=2562451 RepID=UPI0014326628|nr:TPM domain-containing protein [Vagococcus xieshaowenii]
MGGIVKKIPYLGFIVLLGWLMFVLPASMLASENNIFVEDYAGVLSDKQKATIKEMNDVTFKNLEGAPQYAVVTLPNLEGQSSIEDYAVRKFEQLGVGQSDLDNGFLFVIAIEDRKYRLEVGYGVEDVITDSMKEDIVSDEATELLQDEQYGDAIMLISKNVEKVVVDRYGNYEASKQQVVEEKARQAQMFHMFGQVIVSLVSATGLGALGYMMYLFIIKKKISHTYINEQVEGYHFESAKTIASVPIAAKKQRVSFAKLYAQKSKRNQLPLNQLPDVLAVGLVEDAIMQYQQANRGRNVYKVPIYLEGEQLAELTQQLVEAFDSFKLPLKVNPYLQAPYIEQIGHYVEHRTIEHQHLLAISDHNKQMVENISYRYTEHIGALNKTTIENELLVALMTYRLLEGKNLSDDSLLSQLDFSDQPLASAYQYAEKQRKKIAKDKREKALNDLSNMTLGDYYLQTLIWSSYASSSGGGFSGGGSSFGGGSSGGGGFSGGW